MRTKKLLFLPILIAVLALNAQKPDLVLPVGQFEAIMKVDFSKDGRNILTGSTDGTAQLWDLAGYSLQTFGEKNDGRILWSSFSPDGRGVYTRIGRNGLVRLMGLDGAVLDSFESGTPNAYASLTPDCPCDDPLFNAPHLIVLKSEIALYAFSLNKEVKESESVYNLLSDEDMVSSFIAVTPFCSARTETAGSKQLILIEDYERGGLLLVDEDGQARDSLPIEGVLHPAFSGDGRSMLFESNKLLLWDTPDRQVIGLEGAEVPRRGFADAFSPDGEYFVTPMMDGTAALWNRAGEVVHSFGAQSYGISSATFSPDGAYFLMGFNDGSAKLFNRQYELLRVFDNPANTAEEIAYSATCSPEASNVLLRPSIVIKSRDGTVNSWELEQGQVRLEPSGFPCDTWSDQLELSSTGPLPASTQRSPTFLLEASGTGRVSCKSRETGELLAELIAVGESDWVVTTPSGLFDASPGAMQRLHYTAFYDNTYEVIELEQLKERYYEPGLLQKILGYSNEPIRSVEGFDTIALYPQINLSLDTLSHRLDVKLVLRNGGIGKTSIFINGKEIIPDANPPRGFNRQRDTAFAINLAEYRRYFLQDSLNTISVRAYNEAGWLKSPAHTLAYRPRFARTRGNTGSDVSTPSFQPIRDPALYAIIVGTANYAGDKLDLKFPGKDAAAMAQAIQQAGGQLFEDRVHVRLFTTDTTDRSRHPTRANIKAAFDDFNRQANAEDILLVYLSGHGVTYGDADRAQFYYLTQDISSENLSDEAVRRTRTLSTDTLTKWINDIPAQKQVMILDACNSGKVVEALETGTKNLNSSQIRALDRMKDRTGMYVLAGSAADKVSYEASQYGQGLLTYSLLDWMKYRAIEGDSTVDVVRLFEYARDQVPVLARDIGGVQTPTLATPSSGGFSIGIINEKVEIPLPQVKPVFVRNVFLDTDTFYDALKIGKRLEGQLQEITAKGARASLIYVDVPEYKNAYSINGFYRVKNGEVALEARLFKGQAALGTIEAKGQAGQLNALVEEVLRQAFGILQKK